ncbi:MAG: transcription elongation factor Spt5 [Candidatus Nanohaloarchaeota archaeon QJJ-9]|nr:transcription elongation factor Spt5 [Candidatus Nanohaloarchaeota archaeon QJJ-9]
MPIITIRTTRGREKTAVKSMRAKIDNEDYAIEAILYPEDLRGYLFVEGTERDIKDLTQNIRHVKGVIDEEVDIEDLEKYLSEEATEEIQVEPGDKVEVIGGPFKGEVAKVKRIDEANGEATIKMLEAAVPIPVTIGVEMLRKRSEE